MKTNSVWAAKPRFEVLDGLRGVAALMVVAFHLLESYSGDDHTKQIINHGYLAVDFFFALSGFVIGYAYDDRWTQGLTTWGSFKRRLIRLHPMVVLGTLLGAALFYFGACSDWKPILETSGLKLIAVTLICCTIIPITKSMDIRGWSETNPLNGPVWSLQWEYLANILYALVIRRFKTWMLAAFVVGCAFLTLNLTLNWDVTHSFAGRDYAVFTVIGGWSLTEEQLLIGLSRLLYPFFAGLLLSRLKGIIPVPRFGFLLSSGLVVATMAMPYFAPKGSPWVNGLYEALVILLAFPLIVALGAGSKLAEGRGASLCKFLGGISYPLYLVHFPFVCMQKAWVANHPTATVSQNAAVCISCWLVAVALAFAAWKLYDLPVRKWLSGKTSSPVGAQDEIKTPEDIGSDHRISRMSLVLPKMSRFRSTSRAVASSFPWTVTGSLKLEIEAKCLMVKSGEMRVCFTFYGEHMPSGACS